MLCENEAKQLPSHVVFTFHVHIIFIMYFFHHFSTFKLMTWGPTMGFRMWSAWPRAIFQALLPTCQTHLMRLGDLRACEFEGIMLDRPFGVFLLKYFKYIYDYTYIYIYYISIYIYIKLYKCDFSKDISPDSGSSV